MMIIIDRYILCFTKRGYSETQSLEIMIHFRDYEVMNPCSDKLTGAGLSISGDHDKVTGSLAPMAFLMQLWALMCGGTCEPVVYMANI